MSATEHLGGCLCGATRYRIAGTPTFAAYCHCQSCRRAGGAPYVAWGTFPKTRFAFVGSPPARYRSSAPVVRTFCATCGSPLTYEHSGRSEELDVTLASFDEPGAVTPTCHIWVAAKLPWVVLADGLPQFPEWPGA